VEKGSITVDGISLTVVEAAADWFTVSLIPTTLELTTLGIKQPGPRSTSKWDVIAKYGSGCWAPGRCRRAGFPWAGLPRAPRWTGLPRAASVNGLAAGGLPGSEGTK